MIHAKPQLALFLARLIGYRINDAVITKDEINGLYESPHFRRLTHGTHAPNRVVGGKHWQRGGHVYFWLEATLLVRPNSMKDLHIRPFCAIWIRKNWVSVCKRHSAFPDYVICSFSSSLSWTSWSHMPDIHPASPACHSSWLRLWHLSFPSWLCISYSMLAFNQPPFLLVNVTIDYLLLQCQRFWTCFGDHNRLYRVASNKKGDMDVFRATFTCRWWFRRVNSTALALPDSRPLRL